MTYSFTILGIPPTIAVYDAMENNCIMLVFIVIPEVDETHLEARLSTGDCIDLYYYFKRIGVID